MPRLSRVCASAALLLISAEALSAISKESALIKAEIVVVGELKLSSFFLSVDGVHVNGSITPTEVLYGGAQNGAPLAFHYVVPCSVVDALNWVLGREFQCSYRLVWEHWSESKTLLTQPGIWTLWRADSSWTTANQGSLFHYPLSDRQYAIDVLKRRSQGERDGKKP